MTLEIAVFCTKYVQLSDVYNSKTTLYVWGLKNLSAKPLLFRQKWSKFYKLPGTNSPDPMGISPWASLHGVDPQNPTFKAYRRPCSNNVLYTLQLNWRTSDFDTQCAKLQQRDSWKWLKIIRRQGEWKMAAAVNWQTFGGIASIGVISGAGGLRPRFGKMTEWKRWRRRKM